MSALDEGVQQALEEYETLEQASIMQNGADHHFTLNTLWQMGACAALRCHSPIDETECHLIAR